MLWTLANVVVALIGFVIAPRLVLHRVGRAERAGSAWLLWAGAALFVVSWHLPNPDLGGRTDTFTQHAVGGGVACACLALYISLHAGVRSRVLRLGMAYAVTSVLGVLNELAEVVSDEVLGTALTIDSAWDLVANTTGALVGAAVLEAWLAVRRRR